MKSKKLLALVLSGAIALSTVGMTAFAAGGYNDVAEIPGYSAEEGKIVFRCTYLDTDGTSHEATYNYSISVFNQETLKTSGYSITINGTGLGAKVTISEPTKDNYTFDGWEIQSDGANKGKIVKTGDKLTDDDYGCTLVPVFSQTDEQKSAEATALAAEAATLAEEAKTAAEAADDKESAQAAQAKLDEAKAKLAEAKEKDSTVDTSAADSAISDAQTAVDTANATYNPAPAPTTTTTAAAGGTTATTAASSSTSEKTEMAELSNGTRLYMRPVYGIEAQGAAKKAGVSGTNYVVYDIGRIGGGTDGGKVIATIPALANKKVRIYHVHDDKSESLGSAQANAKGNIEFTTGSFSYFVFTYTGGSVTSTSSPNTGDFSAVPIVLAAVAALGTTGAVLYRKKKALAD